MGKRKTPLKEKVISDPDVEPKIGQPEEVKESSSEKSEFSNHPKFDKFKTSKEQ